MKYHLDNGSLRVWGTCSAGSKANSKGLCGFPMEETFDGI